MQATILDLSAEAEERASVANPFPPRHGTLATAAVLVSVVLWSTAYALSSVVLVTASPAVLSVVRLGLALPLLVLLTLLRRPRPGRALMAALRRPLTVALGLTGVTLFYLPSNVGLASSSAGTAALMSASLPVLTTLLAWLLIGERLSLRGGAGLVLATAGIVIGSAGTGALGWGAVLLVAGLLSYALYTVLLRARGTRAARIADAAGTPAVDSDSLELATATAIWGTVLLLPWLAWEMATGTAAAPSDASGWFSILFLALVVTGPTMALFNYGAERVPAALSGIAAAAVPVLAYLFAVALGEPLRVLGVVGAALAVAGIVIATLPASAARAESATSLTRIGAD